MLISHREILRDLRKTPTFRTRKQSELQFGNSCPPGAIIPFSLEQKKLQRFIFSLRYNNSDAKRLLLPAAQIPLPFQAIFHTVCMQNIGCYNENRRHIAIFDCRILGSLQWKLNPIRRFRTYYSPTPFIHNFARSTHSGHKHANWHVQLFRLHSLLISKLARCNRHSKCCLGCQLFFQYHGRHNKRFRNKGWFN